MIRRSLSFAFAILVGGGLLAACGGPTPPPPVPQPPAALSAAPDAARPGEVVTVSGQHLGASGTLSIGGAAVTTSSWADGQVVFTVPSTAAPGPQALTVTTEAGSASTDLFVGVDFGSGTLEGLAALALPKGTAVRLAAGTYSASSRVTLDNLSLYGRGQGTTVVRNAYPNPLYLLADDGYELMLADLTLRSDATVITSGPLVLPSALGVASSSFPWAEPSITYEALAPFVDSPILAAQASAPTSFTLRRLTIEPASAMPFGLVTVDSSGLGAYYAGAVSMSDVTATGLPIGLFAAGAVDVKNLSSRKATGFAAVSLTQHVQVENLVASTVGGGGFLGAAVVLGGSRGLTLTNSEITAVDSHVMLYTALSTGMPLGSGASTIKGNKIRAVDADPLDGADYGMVELSATLGTVDFSDNELTAEGGFVYVSGEAATLLRGNSITLGSQYVGYTELSLHMDEGILALDGNRAEFLSKGGLVVHEDGGQVIMTHNTVVGHNNTGTALRIDHGEDALEFSATGNTFTRFEQALNIERTSPTADVLTAQINDNVFDFVIDAAPKAATVVNFFATDGALDARDNRWGSNTSAATVASYVTYSGGDPATLLVDPIKLP